MYGERDTPGKVISRLGQRLETTLAPDAVLPTIVETVAQALKLPYVEVAIYRIAQEALTNVVRHANAQHCRLTLEVDNDACLEVCDDGQSLPAGFRMGVGLTSMRERAAELGGTCEVSSVDAGGVLSSSAYH